MANGFNEAAGADPADAAPAVLMSRNRQSRASMRPRGQTPRMPVKIIRKIKTSDCFNEAAGADPADASAKMKGNLDSMLLSASMRPRGQTPRMPAGYHDYPSRWSRIGFNEAAGADPADAGPLHYILKYPRPLQ